MEQRNRKSTTPFSWKGKYKLEAKKKGKIVDLVGILSVKIGILMFPFSKSGIHTTKKKQGNDEFDEVP